MSRICRTHWLALGAAVAIAGCASNPANGSSATAYGELGPESQINGVWLDSVGGLWMDSVGVIHHGRRGRLAELNGEALSSMTNQNIVAHLVAGDSLEVALSQMGVDRATDPDVRAFAQRMVNEHTSHRDMSLRTTSQAGVTAMVAPVDTLDDVFATRMENRLANLSGAEWDRGFMGEEVVIHRHMLADLKAMRPQATGVAQQLIDQTIPVVKSHLVDANKLWHKIGGKASQRGTSAFPGGN